jgi:glyoxalase family protein
MPSQIRGLHHVTAMASDARANNAFFTDTLGLRRVKKTVNFDAPDVYHLYYGDAAGTPGTIMTYFPFPHIAARRRGTGEVGTTVFAVPRGALGYWRERLESRGADDLASGQRFGEERLGFLGPDGDELALVESDDDRAPWAEGGVPEHAAIRGFHSVSLRLRDPAPTAELLKVLNYAEADRAGEVTRYAVAGGSAAHVIDVEAHPSGDDARQGAGSVHHIAFAVADRAAQTEVRQGLIDTGCQVTPVIDRDYFWSIYFRSPGGVLFEVATNEPGFARDEDPAHLGEALKLPSQHAHLRAHLEKHLQPLE